LYSFTKLKQKKLSTFINTHKELFHVDYGKVYQSDCTLSTNTITNSNTNYALIDSIYSSYSRHTNDMNDDVTFKSELASTIDRAINIVSSPLLSFLKDLDPQPNESNIQMAEAKLIARAAVIYLISRLKLLDIHRIASLPEQQKQPCLSSLFDTNTSNNDELEAIARFIVHEAFLKLYNI